MVQNAQMRSLFVQHTRYGWQCGSCARDLHNVFVLRSWLHWTTELLCAKPTEVSLCRGWFKVIIQIAGLVKPN